MSLTSTERDLVEHMAQEQFRYESIFEEQRKILITDQAKYEQAIAKVRQSSFVANPGQRWQPPQDKVDEYIAKCDEICHSVPRDIEDRVKIMFAAHAALMCTITGKIAHQRECVQLAILRRHREIWLSADSTTSGPSTSNSRGSITRDSEKPISKPSVDPRRITAEDLRLFEIPDNLHGKQFLLSPDSDESCMYEVIGYSRKRDKTVTYDVLFDDCVDPIPVEVKEMMGMLEDSLYFPA